MAVIVRHRESGAKYILLGAGFGAYKALRPGMFFGHLAPHEESGELPVALVCDAEGAATWVQSKNLEVLSVDGEKPSEILARES